MLLGSLHVAVGCCTGTLPGSLPYTTHCKLGWLVNWYTAGSLQAGWLAHWDTAGTLHVGMVG